jgi:hypothetical protein
MPIVVLDVIAAAWKIPEKINKENSLLLPFVKK